MNRKIILAEEFSRYPGGRSKDMGKYSGEQFREEILRPAIAKGDFPITIDLDGVFTLAPSFIDESLGVLLREYGVDTFDKMFKIKLTDDLDARDDWEGIRHQAKNQPTK